MKKEMVCLNIDHDLHKRLKSFCKLKNQSISSWIESEIKLLDKPNFDEIQWETFNDLDWFKNNSGNTIY